MLSKEKIAAKKNTTTAAAGGPPGKKKDTNGVDTKKVKKQLAALIGATATIPDEPKQATATKEGKPQPPSAKKALRWALKKFGDAEVAKQAKATKLKPKRWALMKYAEFMAENSPNNPQISRADEARGEAKKNDAMAALEAGAKKRSAKKAQAEAETRDSEIAKSILSLKVSTDEALKNALNAFIDGPIKEVLESFVALYASRNTDGDSDEAVLALDACRKAFDACGLILSDVETTKKKPTPIASQKKAPKKEAAKKPTKKKSKK